MEYPLQTYVPFECEIWVSTTGVVTDFLMAAGWTKVAECEWDQDFWDNWKETMADEDGFFGFYNIEFDAVEAKLVKYKVLKAQRNQSDAKMARNVRRRESDIKKTIYNLWLLTKLNIFVIIIFIVCIKVPIKVSKLEGKKLKQEYQILSKKIPGYFPHKFALERAIGT